MRRGPLYVLAAIGAASVALLGLVAWIFYGMAKGAAT